MNQTLQDLRAQLDDIDGTIMSLLAERFCVTAKVGQLKRDNHLPPQDVSREAELFDRIERMAVDVGVAPKLARSLWRQIVDEVIQNHKAPPAIGSDPIAGGLGVRGERFTK